MDARVVDRVIAEIEANPIGAMIDLVLLSRLEKAGDPRLRRSRHGILIPR